MKKNVPENIWKRVQIGGPDECWPWIGKSRHTFGYGQICINYKNRSAHRLAYELTYGPIPAGLFVCHHCDNPSCCNPAHLYLGEPKDNSRDMVERGRQTLHFGSAHHAAKLTEDQVAEIRRRRANGERGVSLAKEFGVSPPTITRLMKDARAYLRVAA